MDGSDVLHCPPHLRKEKLPRRFAATPLIHLKKPPRSAFLLCPCPVPKQAMNMDKITSLPPLWLLLHRYGAARVAAERKIGNLSPGNFAIPDGQARMAE